MLCFRNPKNKIKYLDIPEENLVKLTQLMEKLAERGKKEEGVNNG